ncbi:metalloregulator ArsR/SmtB family transcription factor [Gorillibacterium sp. CAU 1737]|uniref:ArsR/SmtB family transcription factor n=1 Tax=Gorillibacterium sp. CAU 1737 TaxID=3140362 RepID=UPI0032607C65
MDRQERLKNLAEEFKECNKALAAIGDLTRQSIIMALIDGEKACETGKRVGELTERTHLSRPAISHHLKVLKEANLIGLDKEGTKNYYYLDVLDRQAQTIVRPYRRVYP